MSIRLCIYFPACRRHDSITTLCHFKVLPLKTEDISKKEYHKKQAHNQLIKTFPH